ALYWLLLPWGRVVAFAGGVLGSCVAAAGGVTFESEIAAQVLALVALALAWQGLRRGRSGSLVAAGFVAGLAGLFRAETAAVTVLALVPLLLGARRRSLALGAAAFVCALTPYVPLAIATGSSRIERIFDDLVAPGHA